MFHIGYVVITVRGPVLCVLLASGCTSSIVTRSSHAHAWFSPSFLSYWLNHVSNVFQQMTVKTDPQG